MHSGFLTTTKDDDGTSINPASRNLFNRSGSTPTLGPRSSAIHKRGASSGSNMRSYSSLLAALEDQAPYQQYRARQRRDAAMGESVWDDEMEAAFMEGEYFYLYRCRRC